MEFTFTQKLSQLSVSFEKVFWNVTCSYEDFILISQKNCVQNCPNVWFAFCILNKLCCSKVDSWLLPKITSWQGKSEEEEKEEEKEEEEKKEEEMEEEEELRKEAAAQRRPSPGGI